MDLFNILLSTATLCLLAVTIPALWRYFVVKYKLRHLKGPRGLPLLGNILQVGKDNVSFMKQLGAWVEEFRDSGYYVFYIGPRPILVIYNVNDIETILRNSKITRKGFFYFFVESWLGNGLILSDGPKWVSRRKMLTPSFHFSMLTNFLDVINEHAKHLTDKLCSLVDEPEVELLGLISLGSVDVLNECMMGKRLGAQQGKAETYVNGVHRVGEILINRLQYPWIWNDTLFKWSSLGKEQVQLEATLHEITKTIIKNRKSEAQKRANDSTIDDKSQEVRKRRKLALLDLLIEVQKQDNTLTDEGIQEEVDTFMFAGHDTVSSSITFAMYLIGKHPEVKRKLQKELDEVFGNDRDRPVTMEDLQKLEYLDCVLKEGQRLFSPVPIIAKELVNDFRVCGTVVPKGTSIFVGLYWLHYDAKQFPDPQKFDPDRFLPANREGRHNFAFIPFSAGSRNCIGSKFAIMEQKVFMATALRKIDLTSQQTIEELKLSAEMILRPTTGVRVKLNLRQ